MKAQFTYVLICAVLGSAFSNNAYPKIHHARHRSSARLQNREQSPLLGALNNTQDLQVSLNDSSSLLGFNNGVSNVACIFNFSSNIVLLLDGKSGNGVALNSSDESVVKLSNVWVASQQDFAHFLAQLTSVDDIVKSGDSTNAAANLQELNTLAAQIGIRDNALQVLSNISRTLKTLDRRVIHGLLGETPSLPPDGVARFGTILESLLALFNSPSGLTQIFQNGNGFKLSFITKAANGIEGFVKVLKFIGLTLKLKLAKLVGLPLQKLDAILKIIVGFGTNNTGPDNAVRIIDNVDGALKGRVSIDEFLRIIFENLQNRGASINASDITPVLSNLSRVSEFQNSTFNNSGLDVLTTFLRDIEQEKLSLSDINVSHLLALVRSGDSAAVVNFIVSSFIRLNKVFNPIKAIPRLFLHLVRLLKNQNGSDFLSGFPGLGSNLTQDLNSTWLWQGNGALGNVPNIGQLYNFLSDSVRNSSNGSLNLSDILKGGGLFGSSGFFGSFLNGFNWFRPPPIGPIGPILPPFPAIIRNCTSPPNIADTPTLPATTETAPVQNVTESRVKIKKDSRIHHIVKNHADRRRKQHETKHEGHKESHKKGHKGHKEY